MQGLASQIRTNIIYGIVALMPIAVVVYVLVKLFGFLKRLLEPLTPYLDDSPSLELGCCWRSPSSPCLPYATYSGS